MKEAVLNKMNPKERKILEAELQKVYTKQTHSFRDAGKAVWNTKGIRELLDGCTEYAGCYFKCNIALLQAFEKERQMEEEDEEEDLGWKEEFAPCRSRKLPCYTIRPGKRFEKILYSKCTHRTHSLRGYGNAGIWFRPLQTGKPGSLQGQNRSIGRGASLWR